jgi:two-component system, chemotaxis family, chemotaxis protein CheY
MRAMVVDDSRATRAILRRILEQLDFEVTEAADGQEGLEAWQADPTIRLALVDWNMPVMNGLDLVRAIRAQESVGRVVIVMVTTEGDTDHILTALDAGADEYAMKPFTAAVIAEKLELLGVRS